MIDKIYYRRLLVLIGLTIVAIVIVACLKPVAQDTGFHAFADTRSIWGIPNFFNVITNLPFVFVGLYGLIMLSKSSAPRSIALIYAVLFIGIVLTGFGSAYYHYNPNNDTLVWDRMPMTIVFMSFLSAAIAQCLGISAGVRLLFPLVALGIGSVLWWHYTESDGAGDLRFYGLIQFYPVVFIPLIFLLFPTPGKKKVLMLFLWIIAWYLVAKVLEHFDHEILASTNLVSGHSLKHLAAAVSTWWIVKIFR